MHEEMPPKPEHPAEEALWYFARCANWGCLHPLDTDRFYKFIVSAHGHGLKWDGDMLSKQLLEYGMPTELAAPRGQRYEFGRCVLVKLDRLNDTDISPVCGAEAWQ